MPIMCETSVFSDGNHPLWISVLQALSEKISRAQMDGLLRSTHVLGVSPARLSLGIAQPKIKRWMQDGRIRGLQSVLTRLTDGLCELALIPLRTPANGSSDGPIAVPRFLASPANPATHQLIDRVVEKPGRHANPLVLWGPSGSGKSHLLHAIANRLAASISPRAILVTRADSLSLALISAIRTDAIHTFRETLHAGHALLIDDIQQLSGHEATQEELLRTLKKASRSPAQVVLTSSISPDEIEGLIPPIREALSRATRHALVAPEWETRVAIVLERISDWQVQTQAEVATAIVSRLGPGLQHLDAVITQLMNHPLFKGVLNDVALVRRILSQGLRRMGDLSPDSVLGVVTHHFNLRLRDLRSVTRSPRVTTPRQIAMYLVRRHCGLSYPEIGRRFHRHHTTALHACRQMEKLRSHNAGLHATLSLLEKELLRAENSA